MVNDDITVQILRDIRDEIRTTNTRLDEHIEATRSGFEDVGRKIEDVGRKFEDVGRKIVESEVRVATEIITVAGTLQDVRQLLREQRDLHARVDRCEHDIADLKRQLGT